MQFVIRGNHMEVTAALQEYVQRKIGRLEKYFEHAGNTEVRVTLAARKGEHTVEVTIPLSGITLRAEQRSTDMYASIDEVGEKLESQIRKHKTRINKRIRHDATTRIVMEKNIDATTVLTEDEESFDVVRTKRFPMKPMDIDEAILQMNLVGHSFYVFCNADTKFVNVVYRRADGTYGLIEPAL